MNLNSLETLFLLLLFFLPGYVYSSLKAKFKHHVWENKDFIIAISFLFTSIIFQIIAWLIVIQWFHQNLIEILKSTENFNGFLFKNLDVISKQIGVSVVIAVLWAILTSMKQLRRAVFNFTEKFRINKFLNLGVEYVPPLQGSIEHYLDFDRNYIVAIIELHDGTIFEGNVKHIGYGSNKNDYLIVLRQVNEIKKGAKKALPAELKVLIPYANIKSIYFKEFPVDSKSSGGSGFILPMVSFSLLLLVILLYLLFRIQSIVSNTDFLKILVELFGAFVVTFLGVYLSLLFSKKQQEEKNKKDNEAIYTGSLKILASELDLNKDTLTILHQAISNIPDNVGKLYDNYEFLINMSKVVKTNAFNNLISSGGFLEISKNDEIFNKTQQAYFNMELATNGLLISQNVFADFKNIPGDKIPNEIKVHSMGIVKKEKDKIRRSLIMVKNAKLQIIKELKNFGVVFKNEKEEINF